MNRPIGRLLLLVLAVLVPGTLTTFAGGGQPQDTSDPPPPQNQGDAFVCDLNDGRIDLELHPDGTVRYEMDVMYGAFNVYRGEVDVMISAGIYTQDIAGVAGASRWCDRSTGMLTDGYTPPLGHIAFYVATGTRTDGESFPGQTSAQSDRPHHHACHPCTADTDCAGGLYCSKAPGNCAGKGVCARPPTACPDVWLPVCACGGVTYSNACDAAAAGANIQYNGECRLECLGNFVCGAGEYCAKPDGACSATGLCTTRPEVCTTHIDPVCGCDGQTYQNACWAANSGVSVRHDGACGTPCTTNAQCATNQYCQTSGCGGQGECQQRPQGCITLWLPVCGCDAMTYGNGCEAAAAGVNIHHNGECGPCTSNAQCFSGPFPGSGEYCAKPDFSCGATGTCTLRPEVCPDVEQEVCGCNGSQYMNSCVAHRNGTNVADWSFCTP